MTDRNTLHYTADHEWLAVDGDVVTIGITDYAADQLGDVVFVELPAVGTTVSAASIIGEIESTKSVGELFAPVDGDVIEINDAVVDDPSLVNSAPFEGGWLIRVRMSGDLPADLLDAAGYAAHTGAGA